MFRLYFALLFICCSNAFAQNRTPEQFAEHIAPADILIGNEPDTIWLLGTNVWHIFQYDTKNHKIIHPGIVPSPANEGRMRWMPDKQHIAVAGRGGITIVDTKKTQPNIGETSLFPGVFASISDVCFHQTGEKTTIYAASRFENKVYAIDGTEYKEFPAGREPIALTITPDGQTLIVADHLPEQPPTTLDASAAVQFINTQTGQTQTVRLTNGAMNIRDLVLSPDGRYVFVTGIIGHFQRMPNDVNGGWMNENVLFVLDVKQQKYLHTQTLDDYAVGSANPWGVSVSDDEQFLLAAAAGSCDVLMLHLPRFLAMLDEYAGYPVRPTEAADFPMMMRIPVGLKGVRHAVMSKGQIFASSYFEDALIRIVPVFSAPSGFTPGITPKDTLEIPRNMPFTLRPDVSTPYRVNYAAGTEKQTENAAQRNSPSEQPLADFSLAPGIVFKRSLIRLGPEPVWSKKRYGEMLFHDGVICKNHWQSCSTCHPDGRSDGLNWDLLNDGQDNPKNTKSLLFSHITPPSMAHGVRKDAETAVRKGFETILMISATPEEADAVDEYLRQLPLTRPQKDLNPTLDPKQWKPMLTRERALYIGRGQRVFYRAGCAVCHPKDSYYTDMQMHDVGTRSGVDTGDLFDTPTLIEVWRTAPYLHDGRYTTIRELIKVGRHYNVDKLTDAEMDDLIEFVLAL